MSILVISCSLNPESRSRVLAKEAAAILKQKGQPGELLDTADLDLPICDGAAAYGHPAVGPLAHRIAAASGILLAFPVYNYDAGSVCKNLIELTGKAWTGKVVALAAAAGGPLAYMAPMQIANSLMLDFRCIVLPRYVYAGGESVDQAKSADGEILRRLEEMVSELVRVSEALGGVS